MGLTISALIGRAESGEYLLGPWRFRIFGYRCDSFAHIKGVEISLGGSQLSCPGRAIAQAPPPLSLGSSTLPKERAVGGRSPVASNAPSVGSKNARNQSGTLMRGGTERTRGRRGGAEGGQRGSGPVRGASLSPVATGGLSDQHSGGGGSSI